MFAPCCDLYPPLHARVVKLVDTQDSGSCDRKIMGVQVSPRALGFRWNFAGADDLGADCHPPLGHWFPFIIFNPMNRICFRSYWIYTFRNRLLLQRK